MQLQLEIAMARGEESSDYNNIVESSTCESLDDEENTGSKHYSASEERERE